MQDSYYLQKAKYYDNLLKQLNTNDSDNIDVIQFNRKKYKYLIKHELLGGNNLCSNTFANSKLKS